MSLNTYTVTSPLKYNGERFEVGDPIELCDEMAAQLKACRTVKGPAHPDTTNVVDLNPAPSQDNPNRKTAPDDPEERAAAIKEAISKLEPDNEAHWNNDGSPDARALTELLGWPVKAAERNDVWISMQADPEADE